eukprot:3770230-Pleurochrysis_carterae.AAC.4
MNAFSCQYSLVHLALSSSVECAEQHGNEQHDKAHAGLAVLLVCTVYGGRCLKIEIGRLVAGISRQHVDGVTRQRREERAQLELAELRAPSLVPAPSRGVDDTSRLPVSSYGTYDTCTH